MIGGVLTMMALGVVAPQAEAPDRSWRKELRHKGVEQGGGPVSGLPWAGERSFASLDAYLAYLRHYAAPIDRPWYREIAAGVYRLETGNLRGGGAPRVFTREQLERKFGFKR